MDGTGDHIKQSKSGSERHGSHVFFHMWKLDLKDKCIHKYIISFIYIYTYFKYVFLNMYIYKMFAIVRLFERIRGRWERKKEC
jgi:hypothetical protein